MRAWPAITVAGPGLGRADLFQAALLDYAIAAIDDNSPDAWRLFFHDAGERDRALAALPSQFSDLNFASLDVDDEDWAARSQASLTAIEVGDIVVTPPWDAETARLKPGTTAVVIQPSMGFGTGHHATTRLCLAALQRAHVRGRSVIDVGTGSGVLAIAASLLGASPVVAIDDDPDAIQNARENLGLNPGAEVDLRLGDLRASTLGVADVVLANLTGTLLVQAAPQLKALRAPHGRLILSGLLQPEDADVVRAFAPLRVLDRVQEDEWMCLVLASDAAFQ